MTVDIDTIKRLLSFVTSGILADAEFMRYTNMTVEQAYDSIYGW